MIHFSQFDKINEKTIAIRGLFVSCKLFLLDFLEKEKKEEIEKGKQIFDIIFDTIA